jgi:pyrroloquinoline-quinone synthase
MNSFIERLDSAIQEYALLSHPFYQAWNAGTLTNETLREYAQQYYQFERAFPTYVSAVHSNTEDAVIRQHLLENLIDEEGSGNNTSVSHPELWLRFAEAVGCNRDAVKNATPFAETNALRETMRELTKNGDTIEGLSALYGYESQIPEVSRTKIQGLRKFYGVTTTNGLAFFRVHEKADEWHSQTEREMLAALVTSPEDEERAINAARSSAKAIYDMLTGVVRECSVECEMPTA